LITQSSLQTKEWRKSQNWYINGKKNECEIFQINLLENILKEYMGFSIKINKSDKRINLFKHNISCIKNPLLNEDGFEWSENFDGEILLNNTLYLFNLKFICDNGGAQNRSLREVYHFAYNQQKIKKYTTETHNLDIIYINILDGNFCFNHINKFKKFTQSNIFIGDTFTFQKEIKKYFKKENLKKELGQFYTTNYEYILQNMYIPKNINLIIEPFAGNCDLLKWTALKDFNYELYDIQPTDKKVIQRDVFLNPPEFTNKFLITNPPYLARNKTKNKDVFDKYKLNDLYKCFIQLLLNNPPVGGILIIPLNFWSSIRKCDISLRKKFLNKFKIIHLNIFEQVVFKDTTYTICSFQFELNYKDFTSQPQNNINLTIYPSNENKMFELNEKNNFTFGGEIYNLLSNEKKFHIYRATKNNCEVAKEKGFLTNINIKCIDDTFNNQIKLFYNENHYIDYTKNLSARSYATLIIQPTLNVEKQKEIVEKFNKLLNEYRKKYKSLFLTNYRESKEESNGSNFARKRISFDLVYNIIEYLLNT
jgi:hypothetical protein